MQIIKISVPILAFFASRCFLMGLLEERSFHFNVMHEISLLPNNGRIEMTIRFLCVRFTFGELASSVLSTFEMTELSVFSQQRTLDSKWQNLLPLCCKSQKKWDFSLRSKWHSLSVITFLKWQSVQNYLCKSVPIIKIYVAIFLLYL